MENGGEIIVRKKLFEKTLLLHKKIASIFGKDIFVAGERCICTQYMKYDLKSKTYKNEWKSYEDYCRYRTLELVVEEIRRKYSSEELSNFLIAEAGVYQGNFSWMIQKLLPECSMFLYDTFESFHENDVRIELQNSYTSEIYMKNITEFFKYEQGKDGLISLVKAKMPNPKKCVFRVGCFPDTISEEKNAEYIFVSLDMDLYKPIYEGIIFFYPRLKEGGFIFIHDYNNAEFSGVKKALKDAEEYLNVKMLFVPLADEGGTVVLCK